MKRGDLIPFLIPVGVAVAIIVWICLVYSILDWTGLGSPW